MIFHYFLNVITSIFPWKVWGKGWSNGETGNFAPKWFSSNPFNNKEIYKDLLFWGWGGKILSFLEMSWTYNKFTIFSQEIQIFWSFKLLYNLFILVCLSVCFLLAAKLLYNSNCLSFSQSVTLRDKCNFSAAIKYRQLKFLWNALLIFTLFCPSVFWSCFKRCKR